MQTVLSDCKQHYGHVITCIYLFYSLKKCFSVEKHDAKWSAKFLLVQPDYALGKQFMGESFKHLRKKEAITLCADMKVRGALENWPRHGRCHSRQWWQYVSRSWSPTGHPLASANIHTTTLLNTSGYHDAIWVFSCVYLGNVSGCGSAQRFRGDCLSRHQYPRLAITITIQLTAREKKTTWSVVHYDKNMATCSQRTLSNSSKMNDFPEGEGIHSSMHCR